MWMDVTLPPLRRLRGEPSLRNREDELGRELYRVHELALRGARVDGQAADRHAHRSRREGLHLELAEIRPVERVGDVRAERVEIEVLGSATDLLVDGEGDADRRAPAISIPREVGDRGHDLRDPGLVVGAEERGAVAGDDVVADARRERGQHLGIERLPRIAREHDRLSLPRLVDDRRDARAGHVGGRVDMGDEPDDRCLDVAGKRREHRVPSFSSASDSPISWSSATSMRERSSCFWVLGRSATAIRRLRVHADVPQEPLEDVFRELLGQRARIRRSRSQAVRAGRRPRASSRRRARSRPRGRSRSAHARCTRSRCRSRSRSSAARARPGSRRSAACLRTERGTVARRRPARTHRRRAGSRRSPSA